MFAFLRGGVGWGGGALRMHHPNCCCRGERLVVVHVAKGRQLRGGKARLLEAALQILGLCVRTRSLVALVCPGTNAPRLHCSLRFTARNPWDRVLSDQVFSACETGWRARSFPFAPSLEIFYVSTTRTKTREEENKITALPGKSFKKNQACLFLSFLSKSRVCVCASVAWTLAADIRAPALS